MKELKISNLGKARSGANTATERTREFWIVAYFLSRCGEQISKKPPKPPVQLQVNNWKKAYEIFYECIGDGRSSSSFNSSLKNGRDAFDSHIDNGRRGWHREGKKTPRKLPYLAAKVFEDFQEVSDATLWHSVKNILSQEETQRNKESYKPTHDREILERRADELLASGNRKPANGNLKPQQKKIETIQYERSPSVVADVLERANGICELCGDKAPFTKPNNKPFLEVHHAIRLADGGTDTVDNAFALCPNCHREAHYGAKKELINRFILKNYNNRGESSSSSCS